jgi:hypothetical protein
VTFEDLISEKIQAARSLDALAGILEELLTGGYAVWPDGQLLSTRQRVAKLHGLTIEIYPREHPPPYFHVRGGGLNASFSILDCTHLEGAMSRSDEDIVRWWHARARSRLIEIWNASRPSDCPVGPIVVDPAA